MKQGGKVWAFASLTLFAIVALWLFAPKPKRPTLTLPELATRSAPITVAVAKRHAAKDEASISGFVRSRVGYAIEGARVCATTAGSEVFWTPLMTCAVTDSRGGYRIAPLVSTAYVVSVAADGFQPASAQLGGDILVSVGEAKTGVDIVLDVGGARLSGLVLDATGGPISGATIRVLRRALPHDTVVTSSGPDGRFAIWLAPGGVTILAQARGYASARIAHVAPSSDLVLVLTPGSTISGRVVAGVTLAPVAGVVVHAVQAHGWNGPTQPSGTSDAEGAFEIQGLEPNTYTLIAEGAGWRGESPAALPIGLAQRLDGVTLTVSAAAAVTGKVVRRGSTTPCSRGSVTLGRPRTLPAQAPVPGDSQTAMVPTILGVLEADGTVRFDAVPAGSYHVEVRCIDFLLSDGPTTLDVGHSDLNGVVWQVDSAVRMLVHVVDELNQPAANAQLWLKSHPANKNGTRPIPFVTDADGKYELTALPPGLYTLEPGNGYHGEPVTVDARSSEKVDATVRLDGRGSILVTVQAPDGRGIDEVEVLAVALGDEATPAADLNATATATLPARTLSRRLLRGGTPGAALGNGRFRIGPLAAGSYRVQVRDGINPPVEPTDLPQGAVRVRAGVAQATVILRRSGSIHGQVVDSSGQALPDLWVSASCSLRSTDSEPNSLVPRIPLRQGSPARAMSDPEGRFRIDGLENDASCRVRAEQPGGSIGVASKVHPGDEIVVTVPAVGSLSGTARQANGSPVARFTISLRDPETGAGRSETVSAVEGRWSLTQVAPGHLQLSAFAPNAGVAQAGIALNAGEQLAGIELEFRSIPLPTQAKP